MSPPIITSKNNRDFPRAEPTKPLRIAIDIRPTQLSSKGRGIGRYVYDLVEGLVRLEPRHEYFLLALPEEAISARFESLPDHCYRVVEVPTTQLQHLPYLAQRYRWEKLPPIWAAKCAYNQAVNAHRLSQVIREHRIDLLHLTSGFEPTFFTDGAYPCPTVKTFYDATPLVMADDFLKRWSYQVRTVYRRQVRQFASGADAIIAISESAKNDAIKTMGIPAGKIHKIYPAIADTFCPTGDRERLHRCRSDYGLGERPFFLFCSGGGANKNRERTVRSFARFAAHHPHGHQYLLVMAGPSGGDETLLRQVARQENLKKEQFILTGFVSDTDLISLYEMAVALLTPSLYEGFGLPAAQALQMGLPVIAGNRSSLPEVIGDAGILVDPTDTESIAAALARMVDNPELRKQFRKRGQERAVRFGWRVQAKAHLDLYAELTAHGKMRGQSL